MASAEPGGTTTQNAAPAQPAAHKRRWKRRSGRKHPDLREAVKAKRSGQAPPVNHTAQPVNLVAQAAATKPLANPARQNGEPRSSPPVDAAANAGIGGIALKLPETALYENGLQATTDLKLTARAVKRWKVDPLMGEQVLRKMGMKALGIPYQRPDGKEEPPEVFTPHQLSLAASVLLAAERMNQVEEHHAERMQYADRALNQRGQYNPAVRAAMKASVPSENGGSRELTMGVAIYLPSNGRDEILDEMLAEPPGDV